MSLLRSFIAAAVALGLTTSCNNTQMAGSAGTQEGKKPEPEATPDKGKPGKDKNPRPDTPGEPGELGNPASSSQEDQGDVVDPTAGGDNSLDGTFGGDASISDLLAGTLQTSSDVTSQQINDNEIIFGGQKSFRIGDNAAFNTSCSQQVLPALLAGRKFYFEFQVMKDGANVTLSVEELCGIDYGDTNFIYVAHAGTAITPEAALGCGEQPRSVSAPGLKKGTYQLVVESRPGAGADCWGRPATVTDHDDFIVGRVRARAEGAPIKPGSVGAVP
jgi:hypothetical protein